MIGGIGATLAQTHDDPHARHRYHWFLPSSTTTGTAIRITLCAGWRRSFSISSWSVVLIGSSVSGRLDFGRTELTVTAKTPAAALRTK
jgi:hypothetical protein